MYLVKELRWDFQQIPAVQLSWNTWNGKVRLTVRHLSISVYLRSLCIIRGFTDQILARDFIDHIKIVAKFTPVLTPVKNPEFKYSRYLIHIIVNGGLTSSVSVISVAIQVN